MASYLSWTLMRSAKVPKNLAQPADLRQLAEFVLRSEKVPGPVTLTLDLTNPTRIQSLNRHFRGVDRTTDVIAFRYDLAEGEAGLTGDVAINVFQTQLQAKRIGHP